MGLSYSTLIEQLAAPNQQIKDRARGELASGGAAAVPFLISALGHSERDVRAGACLALADLKAEGAVQELARVSRVDSDESVRSLALRALVALAKPGCPTCIQSALIKQLHSGDVFSRALACSGLGSIGDAHSLEALSLALRDREQWVRDAARKALQVDQTKTGGRPPPGRSDPPAKRKDASPPAPYSPLVQDLMSLDPKVQKQAQKTLTERGARSIPELAPILLDGPPDVRRLAAEVLGLVGDPAGMIYLRQMLAQRDLPSALSAVAMLSIAGIMKRTGPLDAFPGALVQGYLKSPSSDRFVRGAAVVALLFGNQDDRCNALDAMHEEGDSWVMLRAANTVWEVASPKDFVLIPRIINFLTRLANPEGQVWLLSALCDIVPGPGEEAQQLVGPVCCFLESPIEDVRRVAASLLVRTSSRLPRQIQVPIWDLIEADPVKNMDLIQAMGLLAYPDDPTPISCLRAVMSCPDSSIAREAVAALAAIGGPAAVEALVETANSQAGPVVDYASRALATRDPNTTMSVKRLPTGKWKLKVRRCRECHGLLQWVELHGNQELQCEDCDQA